MNTKNETASVSKKQTQSPVEQSQEIQTAMSPLGTLSVSHRRTAIQEHEDYKIRCYYDEKRIQIVSRNEAMKNFILEREDKLKEICGMENWIPNVPSTIDTSDPDFLSKAKEIARAQKRAKNPWIHKTTKFAHEIEALNIKDPNRSYNDLITFINNEIAAI